MSNLGKELIRDARASLELTPARMKSKRTIMRRNFSQGIGPDPSNWFASSPRKSQAKPILPALSAFASESARTPAYHSQRVTEMAANQALRVLFDIEEYAPTDIEDISYRSVEMVADLIDHVGVVRKHSRGE